MNWSSKYYEGLDDLFYPEFDKLSTDELVADAEEALANESEIKSLNFRS